MKILLFGVLMALLLICNGCATTAEDGAAVFVPKFKISCFGVDLYCTYEPQYEGLNK